MSCFRVLKLTEELLLTFFCLLTLSGRTCGHENGPGVVTVVAAEGSDAILPCSLSSKEDITSKLFHWKKDGHKEVFLYDANIHSNNGYSGQNEQFKGRVSHFPEELKSGNVSIIIRNTKVADSGDYTCDFPRLQPRQIFHIKLVVGAAPKPYVTIVDRTKDWVLLLCDVRGAFPKPKLHWQDRAGNILPAEEPQETERGGSYVIILQTTVTKTNYYRCVATQEGINNQTYSETHAYIHEKRSHPGVVGVCFSGALTVAVVLFLFGARKYNIKHHKKGFPRINVSYKDPSE